MCAVHKHSQRTWPLYAGVFSYGQTVESDRSLEARCGRLLAELQWSGIFNLQFLETAGDQPADLNPRAYHSLALAVAAGANLPAVWCNLLLGLPARTRRARVGVRFRSEVEDLRALWATARRGERAKRSAGCALGAVRRTRWPSRLTLDRCSRSCAEFWLTARSALETEEVTHDRLRSLG